MKASEFRIGNYYNQFGNIEKVSWATLKVLEKRTNEQLWCEPIPLTEEWLLKFGFECNIYRNDDLIYYEKGFLSIDIFNECYINDEKIEIKYVHQLQNLVYALTNEELTYEQQK